MDILQYDNPSCFKKIWMGRRKKYGVVIILKPA